MKSRSHRSRNALCLAVIAMLLLSTFPSTAHAADPPAKETQAEHDKRMAWWREARFGMFIHWGLYAVPAGTWKGKKIRGIGEWIMNRAKIPVAEYEPLVKQFNPVKFDAKQWARIAKQAGMKYMVITSKHHDGFCLWDSKLTDYDIMSTPFKRDILKELTEANKAAGVRMCFYHSIMDWHHPDYAPRRAWDKRPNIPTNYERYVKYMKGQLKELVANYDPGVLWFDGEWEKTWTHEHGKMLYDYVRSLKGDIIINNRVDKGRRGMQGMSSSEYRGDFGTPEQQIPATGFPPGVDWETCMTMNGTWGYKSYDHNWKSTEDLLRKLVDIASKGGNFLLNVGPTPEGRIPVESVKRLLAMGRWLDVNGESIYGTTASPFKRTPWGRCTKKLSAPGSGKPSKLYVHVFTWPKGGSLAVRGLGSKVTKAYLLAQPDKALTATAMAGGAGCEVTGLPAEAPDAIDTVIVLEFQGELQAATPALGQQADGRIELSAADAATHGPRIKLEGEKNCIGYWTDAKAFVTWDVQVAKGGEFNVALTYACDKTSGGSEIILSAGKSKLTHTIEPTGTWEAFKTVPLGKLEIAQAGKVTVAVKAVKKPNLAVMNLRKLALTPAK